MISSSNKLTSIWLNPIQRPNSGASSYVWETSSDGKYMIGYISINRQDLDTFHQGTGGIQLSYGRPCIRSPNMDTSNQNRAQNQQLGTFVEQINPGSLMNIMCKLKVGDEIVELNGNQLRTKSDQEVREILENVKLSSFLRMVVIRLKADK